MCVKQLIPLSYFRVALKHTVLTSMILVDVLEDSPRVFRTIISVRGIGSGNAALRDCDITSDHEISMWTCEKLMIEVHNEYPKTDVIWVVNDFIDFISLI